MAQWFYAANGGQAGPVDTAELKALAAAGSLRPEDLVWKEGLADWVPASKIKGLFGNAVPAAMAPVAVASAPTPRAASTAGVPASAPFDLAYDTAPDPVAASPVSAPAPAHAAPGVLPYVGGSLETADAGARVSVRAIELLSQTRPWVLLCGILLFIIGGLASVAGIGITLFGLLGSGSIGLGGLGAVLGLVYVGIGLLYIVPGLHLSRYAARIATLRAGGRSHQLEHALEAQKSFWRFVGIAVLVVIVVYLVILAFAILSGVMR